MIFPNNMKYCVSLKLNNHLNNNLQSIHKLVFNKVAKTFWIDYLQLMFPERRCEETGLSYSMSPYILSCTITGQAADNPAMFRRPTWMWFSATTSQQSPEVELANVSSRPAKTRCRSLISERNNFQIVMRIFSLFERIRQAQFPIDW